MNIGEYNTLIINRQTDNGYYLIDPDDNEVLLPNKYISEDMSIDDEITVFVYKDSLSRIVATTLEPKVTLGKFGFLSVKAQSDFGAFMDWGLEKELLVPLKEQRHPMKIGSKYLVYLYLDEETDRLAGSTYTRKFLDEGHGDLKVDQVVELLVCEPTDIAWRTIVNGTYEALLFKNEVFTAIQPGDYVKGYIKNLRPDGKIDVCMQASGFKHIRSTKEALIDRLNENKGFLPLTDKSSPEEIMATLGISKKTFKKTIGQLYKEKWIELKNDGIKILPQ